MTRWVPASAPLAIARLRPHQPVLEPEHPSIPLSPAQASATRRARAALHRFGGALIADPPGTGKSFIALQLALEAARSGQSILITAPASLAPLWNRLRRDAGLDCPFLTHTRLSLDDDSITSLPDPDFILVDEAHAFRSPTTRRYHTLARLARRARVLLVSATPINNSLMDLYFQLRLFLADSALADLGVPDLLAAFRNARTARDTALPPLLANALTLLLIRSPDDSATTPHDLPRLQTRLVHYDLDAASPGFTRQTLDALMRLSLAAFAPDPHSTHPPAELLRLTLARRLESGIPAFAATLRSTLAFHQAFLDGLDVGRVVRPRDLGNAPDRSVQLQFAWVLGEPVPRSLDIAATRRLVTADILTLRRLLDDARRLATRDPKRQALLQCLEGRPADRSTLVFTEFRETARDLWNALRSRDGVARLDGQVGWLASGRCPRTEILRRFAPRANHAPTPAARDRIRTLIATDILSEGVNLQDADTVVAYDLPWNPVRVIQRIGRIRRLGSAHASVEALIFMPDRWLDEFMTLVDRVDAKLADIRRGLGSQLPGDRAEDRHLAFLRALAEGVAPTAAAAAASAHPGARHPPGSLAALFEHPALRATPADPPTGTVPVSFVPSGRDPAPLGRALLALDSPGGPRFVRWDGRSVTDIDPSAVAPLLLAAIQAPVTLPALTPAVRASLDHAVRALTAAQVADPATAPTRAMRRVLRLAASGDDPASIAPLADRLLSRLSRGLRAGDLLAVRDWCARAVPPASAGRARLLQDLETTLARTAPAPDAPAPRVLAAFLPQPGPKGRLSATSARSSASCTIVSHGKHLHSCVRVRARPAAGAVLPSYPSRAPRGRMAARASGERRCDGEGNPMGDADPDHRPDGSRLPSAPVSAPGA